MKFTFSFLYGFCILCYFAIGQIPLMGLPINLNIFSILLLFFSCFFVEKPKLDRWMIMYFVFLLFYAISALGTGFWGQYLNHLYSYFFLALVLYWATCILIRRFNTLAPLIYVLLFIGVIDAIVTIFQARGIPIHNPFLTTIIQDTNQEELLASHGNELGIAISGIYGSPVFNGHLLLFFFLVSLLSQYEKFNVIMLLFTLVFFVGIIFCQQRAAFLISIIAFVFVNINKIKASKHRFLFFLVFIVALIAAYYYFVNYLTTSGSRLSDISNTNRNRIWSRAIVFLEDHPFLGGKDLFVKIEGVYPHNLILSAFLAGGLFGGIVLLAMIGDQILYWLKKIRISKNMLFYTVGIMYLSILADSLFHNTGLVDMDIPTFLIWAIFSTILRFGVCPNMSLTKRNNI